MKELDPRFNLIRVLYKQYELNQFYHDFKIMEKKFKKELEARKHECHSDQEDNNEENQKV